MIKKILITGANNAIAYQLAWLLKTYNIEFCDTENHINCVPSATSNSFTHQFLNYCLNHHIQIVFTLKADEQQALNQSKILFAEFGIDLVLATNNDLVNLKNSSYFNKVNTSAMLVNNFESFSAGLLKAGYPTHSVWFDRADGVGDVFQINDEFAGSHFLSTPSTILSFTQASKILNQNNFVPLNIYLTKKNINVCKILLYENKIFSHQNLNFSLLQILKNIQNEYDLNGYFKIVYCDEMLLNINNVQL